MNTKWLQLLSLFVTVSLQAQDTLVLSREDALSKLESRNLQLQIARQSAAEAQGDYNMSMAVFLPQVTVSHTGILTTNPLMAFGSKLNQEILTASDFNPALLNDPSQTKNFATKVEVRQPLINVDGFYQRKASRDRKEIFELQSARTREYLEMEVSKAYLQLQLTYKTVSVLEQSLKSVQAQRKQVQDYYAQGMLQKTDLLNIDVHVSDVASKLASAKNQVRNASDYLAFLLQEDVKGRVFKPASNDLTVPEAFGDFQWQPGRKDLVAMQKVADAHRSMLSATKSGFLPNLNAFGSYEWYDKTAFGATAGGYLVGAQLSWNVFDGYQNIAKADKAKATYMKARIEARQYEGQSKLEMQKTLRQLDEARERSQTAQAALELSREAYRIRKNRYAQGLEKTTDLLQSETQQMQKELEYLHALYEYHITEQYLKFLTQS